MPSEEIPDFTLTTYTYYGLDGEQVPGDTTEVIFDPSATTIQGYTFSYCKSLVRVAMPANITSMKLMLSFVVVP